MENFDEFLESIDKLNESLQKYKKYKNILKDKLKNSENFENREMFENTIVKIKNIYQNINSVTQDIYQLQNDIDKGSIEVTDEEKQRIEENKKYEEMVDDFYPFLFMYYVLKYNDM